MATIGVSKPYYAKYSAENGTVSYSGGGVLGKMTELNIEIETSDDNNLYGDNGIAETDRTFSSGSVTVSTTDLSQAVSRDVLGAKEQELGEIDGVTDEGVKELVFDDRQEQPCLGCGFIIKKMVNHALAWRAVVLTKVMFSVPSDSASTQGESIEWQVPELSGAILRDDTETHMWKREATFTTEAQAEAYLRDRLHIGRAPEAAAPARAGGDPGGEQA